MVVTIDGPAGAGKSTLARMLAKDLGFEFLDTGAMYRCVTLAALESGVDLNDERAVSVLAEELQIDLRGDVVLLNGNDVSQAIRTPEVATSIGKVADNVDVRSQMTKLQRSWTEGKQVVTEGRDQGTEVFADSPCKIFLVASDEERAARRAKELEARGRVVDLETVLEQQKKRDHEDRSRLVGALKKAKDAIEVSTDGKSLPQVLNEVKAIVRERIELANT